MAPDPRLTELLLRWEELHAQGHQVSPESLCADCPELLSELKRRIRVLQSMNERLTLPQLADSQELTEVCGPPADFPVPPPGPVSANSHYTDLKFLARGGLGEVFVARELELNREVVLKFIQRRHLADPESGTRFNMEVEVTSHLEHPGVVPVHGFGQTADGRPFYAMRYIRGQTLQQAIDEYHRQINLPASQRRLGLHRLLRHFCAACNTVAYAHNRGIVHCDIKPDNIMLGKFGETLVVDWGLALSVARDARARASGEPTLRPRSGSDLESSGSGAGTPPYMSPEQTPGSGMPIGPPSDVYSLGATLYRLLTGRMAFQGETPREIWEKVSRGQFPQPRELSPEVPPALEAICLKAMSLRPQDRYATALDLAADVEAWLADEPVSAYDEPRAEQLARWARRHRGGVLAMLAAVALIMAIVSGTAVMLGRMAAAEHEARLAADHARTESLRVAARFAARNVANEVDLRWRVLELAAADLDLRSQLNAPPEELAIGSERQKSLQAWLDARFLEHLQATRATSWTLTDRRGNQLARTPLAETIGDNFSFRDYFHGRGRDLQPEEAQGVQPLRDVHCSLVFRSQANQNLMVVFSVPVWSGKPHAPGSEVLAVLGMSVELARFGSLKTGLSQDQVAVLVDTRPDWVEGSPRRGMILHHPRLTTLRFRERASDLARLVYRLPSQRIEALLKLREEALTRQRARTSLAWEEQLTTEEEPLPGSLVDDYEDPTGGPYEGRWRAAFEPVIVPGRTENIADTGWVVVVQQRLKRE